MGSVIADDTKARTDAGSVTADDTKAGTDAGSVTGNDTNGRDHAGCVTGDDRTGERHPSSDRNTTSATTIPRQVRASINLGTLAVSHSSRR